MDDRRHDEFSQLLQGEYSRVYAYIMSLLHNPQDAYDVIQETALTMWQKFNQFDSDGNFGAWACGIARLKVLEHLEAKKRRGAGRTFGEPLIDLLTEAHQEEDSDTLAERREALMLCLQKLTAHQRQLLQRCYDGKHAVAQVAEEVGRTTHSIYSSLRHLRVKLLECIERRIGAGGV